MANKDERQLPKHSRRAEIDRFLRKVAATPTPRPADQCGRLLFAMDATASREPTWNRACQIQGEMFVQTAALGGLDVQLCYYRGLNEFHSSAWLNGPEALIQRMQSVSCLGGYTQLIRVLQHARDETRKRKVDTLVFIGDCMEEDVDQLRHLAGELGILGVPAFVFQEGVDPVAENAFRQLAKLTGGAYYRFDATSAQQLRELLGAVAVYAAGGHRALEDYGRRRGGAAPRLMDQLKRG